MRNYTSKDILQIAKRFNNKKRTYLLVNPLQAKHIPVSPTESLNMMHALAYKLYANYPNTKLVIGFAETATAIGAVVAESFSEKCIYVHTTRENISSVTNWVSFQEEHSHATDQKIISDNMSSWISNTDTIIFVDDEISTGKTLFNIIEQFKVKFPHMKTKKIVAASLLNRISAENQKRLDNAGIVCEYLVKLPETDYSVDIENISIQEASKSVPVTLDITYQALFCENLHNPRMGVNISAYQRSCNAVAETFVIQFSSKIPHGSSILILGTEECMYPALKIGEIFEYIGHDYQVMCHATTRSPIGLSNQQGYPIFSGNKIKSFFDERDTYIYNLGSYDVVIIVSDTKQKEFEALESLAGAIPNIDDCQLFYIQGGRNVWCARKKQTRTTL